MHGGGAAPPGEFRSRSEENPRKGGLARSRRPPRDFPYVVGWAIRGTGSSPSDSSACRSIFLVSGRTPSRHRSNGSISIRRRSRSISCAADLLLLLRRGCGVVRGRAPPYARL